MFRHSGRVQKCYYYKMTRTGLHNPIVYLEKGFLFPKAEISINADFKGKNFKIINSEEETEDVNIFVPHGGGGSGMGTKYRYLWMSYGKDTDSANNTFIESLDIINIISLLTEGFYFNNSSLDVYVYSGSLSSNVQLNYPDTFIGINIKDDISISNYDIVDLMNRVSLLNQDDYSYFKSAVYLIKEAKKKYYKGENSGSMTEAISAVEALYMRPNTSSGYFDTFDPRFNILAKGKTKAFEEIFCRYDTTLYPTFSPSPYAIRSGHLHSGKIDFYIGPRPRPNDQYLAFILTCQRIIVDTLRVFGV